MTNGNIGQSCGCCNYVSAFQLTNKKVKVILDAAHGGKDIGENVGGILEKDKNLEYALAVGDILTKSGYDVVYTRINDVPMTEDAKRELANTSGADLFVSLHRTTNANHLMNPGVEAIVYEPDVTEMNAALNITKEIEKLGFLNLGVIQAKGGQADYVNYLIPQVYLLVGLLKDPNGKYDYEIKIKELEQATAQGIMDTFKLQAQSLKSNYQYKVQVGSFRIYDDAQALQSKLIINGYKTDIIKEGQNYAVHCGDFNDLDKAVTFEQRLKRAKYHTLILEI
ncbi:MAG TPA: N-acetylmuramoyl-L-alanine amidase [Mobilitalea sp.]|nr:N-acetylmuramoyl-L-alanine amidase [Mobilitalea sp.]